MNKMSEFYTYIIANETAKKELEKILGSTDISKASDEQLVKVGTLAEKLGYKFTLDEVKEFLSPTETELTEDDLDAVAGGKGINVYEKSFGDCREGIGGVRIRIE